MDGGSRTDGAAAAPGSVDRAAAPEDSGEMPSPEAQLVAAPFCATFRDGTPGESRQNVAQNLWRVGG